MVRVLYRICASSGAGNYQREIRQFLWSHRSEKETDLVIISGEETFKVHRAVLLPLSSYLMELLPPSCSCTKPTIFLPSFPSHVLAAALEMLYTGETAIAAFQDYQVQVEEVFALLKVKAGILNASEEHVFYNNVEDIFLQDSSIISDKRNSVTLAVEVADQIESNDEESSFCEAIHSKVKRDENDNSVTSQNLEELTQYHENVYSYDSNEATGLFYGNSVTPQNVQENIPTSFSLNEATGLFYSDGETVKTVNRNSVIMKRKYHSNVTEYEYLFDHGNDTIAKNDYNHSIELRYQRNKLGANDNITMGDNNIDETSLEESNEKDEQVRNVDNYEDYEYERFTKRRFLTKLNYFGSREKQSSLYFPTPKPKKQAGEYLEVCRACNKSFKFILKHLYHGKRGQNCSQVYTNEQLDELKEERKERRKVKQKEHFVKYYSTENGKEVHRRNSAKYRMTEKGKQKRKEIQKRWSTKYYSTEKGKENQKRWNANYRMSEKSKESKKRRNENKANIRKAKEVADVERGMDRDTNFSEDN